MKLKVVSIIPLEDQMMMPYFAPFFESELASQRKDKAKYENHMDPFLREFIVDKWSSRGNYKETAEGKWAKNLMT